MKSLMLIMCLTLMSFMANAGFEGLNQNVSLKVFSRLDCSSGLSCSKVKDKFVLAVSDLGVLRSRVLATATTITAAQCGSTFYNAAAIEMDLPEASTVIGCRLTFVTLNAANFDLDPEAADQILVNTNAVGDRLRNATIGNIVTIEAVSASQWAIVGILGTWTDAD